MAEMETYWIIQTRKWKVETDDARTIDNHVVESFTEDFPPDWERIEVVIEDEPVQLVFTDKEN